MAMQDLRLVGVRKSFGFCYRWDSMLRFGSRLYVPEADDLKKDVMNKAYHTTYIVHPGSNNIYIDLRECY
jgi:hypothetical protein